MASAGHLIVRLWKRFRLGLKHALRAGANYPWALARESGGAPGNQRLSEWALWNTLTLAEKDLYCAGLVPIASHGGTMSEIPEGFLYTEEHEYLKPTDDDDVFLVGVTDYAQGELGDVVYIELPEVGAIFQKMDPFGNIEAVKAVSDLYCPVAGEVLDVNAGLDDDPAVVNSDPYGEGWIIKTPGSKTRSDRRPHGRGCLHVAVGGLIPPGRVCPFMGRTHLDVEQPSWRGSPGAGGLGTLKRLWRPNPALGPDPARTLEVSSCP